MLLSGFAAPSAVGSKPATALGASAAAIHPSHVHRACIHQRYGVMLVVLLVLPSCRSMLTWFRSRL